MAITGDHYHCHNVCDCVCGVRETVTTWWTISDLGYVLYIIGKGGLIHGLLSEMTQEMDFESKMRAQVCIISKSVNIHKSFPIRFEVTKSQNISRYTVVYIYIVQISFKSNDDICPTPSLSTLFLFACLSSTIEKPGGVLKKNCVRLSADSSSKMSSSTSHRGTESARTLSECAQSLLFAMRSMDIHREAKYR